MLEKSLRNDLHCAGDGDWCKERQKTLSRVARARVWMRSPAGANPIDTPTAEGGLEGTSARISASNSATAPRE